MENNITIKEVVEYYFDKHLPLPRVYDIKNQRNYLKRTIESYNPDTGDFTIRGCKTKFNIKDYWGAEIEIESRTEGWADFVCKKFLSRSFQDIQNYIYNKMCRKDEDVLIDNLGGSWMKYSPSCPKIIKLNINGHKVEAVKTYSTVTNINLAGYICGYVYSNTSTRWAYEAGLASHNYCFRAND